MQIVLALVAHGACAPCAQAGMNPCMGRGSFSLGWTFSPGINDCTEGTTAVDHVLQAIGTPTLGKRYHQHVRRCCRRRQPLAPGSLSSAQPHCAGESPEAVVQKRPPRGRSCSNVWLCCLHLEPWLLRTAHALILIADAAGSATRFWLLPRMQGGQPSLGWYAGQKSVSCLVQQCQRNKPTPSDCRAMHVARHRRSSDQFFFVFSRTSTRCRQTRLRLL